jgi:hypothetical protein
MGNSRARLIGSLGEGPLSHMPPCIHFTSPQAVLSSLTAGCSVDSSWGKGVAVFGIKVTLYQCIRGRNGFGLWKYSRHVVDPIVFDTLKVGDRVDITWNTDVTVSVE